ncbi:MAG TPA: HWE histidine kinase domain-containing protein [Xanthobacteraceae bacterium]|nr:HWE histidine kinase domain-containing protein [Xanthobacteraceae bacterium]
MISLLFARLFGGARKLEEANERLRREVTAHEATLRELEAARRELEARVAERTKQLSLMTARFETALRGAKVYVFSQDSDLRYTWVYSPHAEASAAQLLGRTDEQVLAAADRDSVVAVKRRVLATGMPQDCEVAFVAPGGRTLFALHVEPIFGPERTVDGVMCAAVDISRTRLLESEQRRLTEELRTAVQRYETALRGSGVTVFTQDRDLTYTSISNPLLGREVDDIVGRSDEEILPAASRAAVTALKRRVLAEGRPADGEVSIGEGAGRRWFDLHVEPLRDVTGAIVGLIGAAVDNTPRKEAEVHLRLLMRELTHRSKNLLAIVQAMARQTARYTGSVETFMDQFGARLQALAASHDLLVQESWHGASLDELARAQLAQYVDGAGAQVVIQGPGILLKPEAAQSLGLAIYELLDNAARYGALSAPQGRVSLTWCRRPAAQGGGVEIVWAEAGGPSVSAPSRRGFGSLVIERNLAGAAAAEVDLAFPPEGVRCRMVIPDDQLLAN